MKIWKLPLLVIVIATLSCEDATAPRRLRVPSYAHFMQVSVDPTCDYVSTQCAYTINGVTVYGGGDNNPPPLIIWTDPAPDPPSIYDWLPYPTDDNFYGYSGATVGTNSEQMSIGGTIIEEGCDPRPSQDPNCLLPLQPRDSVFLTTVIADMSNCVLYIKCEDEMESQEMSDQCAEMRQWLSGAINETFNRPAGNTSQGFFRGRNGTGSMDNPWVVHGGITNGGSAHADEREWEIYNADSLYTRRHLVEILMHEAVHMFTTNNHGPPTNPDYGAYPYFKYLIPGNRHGCVRV